MLNKQSAIPPTPRGGELPCGGFGEMEIKPTPANADKLIKAANILNELETTQ